VKVVVVSKEVFVLYTRSNGYSVLHIECIIVIIIICIEIIIISLDFIELLQVKANVVAIFWSLLFSVNVC